MARESRKRLADGVLDELLRAAGWDRKTLAARLDVDPAQVTRWAKLRTGPEPEHVKRMASLFETTVGRLYGTTEESPRERLAQELELEVGASEAEVVRLMAAVPAEKRDYVLGAMRMLVEQQGWTGKKKTTPNFDEEQPSEVSAVSPAGVPRAPDRARAQLSRPPLAPGDQTQKPPR